MQREKRPRVARRFSGDLLRRTPERPGDGIQYMREEGRLVAPRLGLGPEIARRQVGRIGFQEQPVRGDLFDEVEQVLAAALVADPARDADVKTELHVSAQLVSLAGEAVRDGASYAMVREDFGKPGMRIARMQEKRLAQRQPELELRDEPLLLVGVRRVVAVEIQAALADGDAVRMGGEGLQLRNRLGAAVARVVRVHAGRERHTEGRSLPAFFDRGAGDDDRVDAGLACAREDFAAIRGESGMREVRADVDEPHAASIRDGYKALPN